MTKPRARYLGSSEDGNRFLLHCTCGAEGELTVPADVRTPFGCPEGCGATYVPIASPLLQSGIPTLVPVVWAVYEDDGEPD